MEALLPAFAPIAVYWVTCWVYEYLVYSREENRLHFGEIEPKNIATRKQVILGTLAIHATQIALAVFYFMVLKTGRLPIMFFTIFDRRVIGRYAVKPKAKAGYLQVAGQISMAMLIMDAWEYFWHRILHENEFLFKNFHALHHRLLVPYSYGAQYTDFFDAFVGQNLGGAVAMAVSGMSPMTSALFFSLISIKAVDDHCGMWLPNWNPMHRFLRNNVSFHSVHHQVYGFKYNYSIHFLATWDMLLGTYCPPGVEERKGGGYILGAAKED
ncbi:sphinganine C4-monooxygenase 1-like isoform X1 [Wolffia australiana]